MKRKPAHQAAHFVEDEPLMNDLVAVLQKHCGQQVNGMLSVEATPAISALSVLLIQLIAPFPDRDREEMFGAIQRAAATASARAKQPMGSA